jgi:DNA-binding FadR family transcriptional regulator
MVKRANSEPSSLRRLPLYQQLQSLICTYIAENQLRPDDPLPAEGELAELFGVSRNSVREAVKSLQVLGVLVSRPGSGLFVGEFSFDPIVDSLPYAIVVDYDDLADLLEVRRTLEVGMVEQIVRSRTDEQVARLSEIIERWKKAITKDNDAYPADLDHLFHAVLIGGVQNQLVAKLLTMFWQVFYRASSRGQLEVPRDSMVTFACHVTVLEALKIGDSEALRASLIAHHRGIDERVRVAKKKAGEDDPGSLDG